jgi:hypothetical protein
MVKPRRLTEMAAELGDGQYLREVCPFCNGGSDGEKSFSMTREGFTAKYICYRASCGVRGRMGYGGNGSTPHDHRGYTAPAKPKVTRFTGELHPLPVKASQYFKTKFNIQPVMLREFAVKQADDGRIVFPIISPSGADRGDNVRAYPDLLPLESSTYTSKALIFKPESEVGLSWHRIGYLNQVGGDDARVLSMPSFFPDVLVILEDQLSAIKASRMVDAVALLGTDLSALKIKEISDEIGKRRLYTKVVLLLDADAYGKALKILMRTRALLPNVIVRKLSADVKDMTYTSICTLLNEVISNDEQDK